MTTEKYELDFNGVLVDLETTGTVPEIDRIVEIAIAELSRDLSGPKMIYTTRVYPGEPIPPEATAIHGISDADVEGAPNFATIAAEVQHWLDGNVVVGYNAARFDVPILEYEFRRAGLEWVPHGVLDVMKMNHVLNPRDLEAAANQYAGGPSGKPHDAASDAVTVGRVLRGMIEMHSLMPSLRCLQDVALPNAAVYVDADRKFAWRFHEPWFVFGKHAGRSLREVAETDRGYLGWMLQQRFHPTTDTVVRDALAGKIPRSDEPAW